MHLYRYTLKVQTCINMASYGLAHVRCKIFHPLLDIRLKALILEKQERYGYRVLGMEVMPDHVHLLSM
jgi:REP element-mobilizing transposase RayT